MDSGNSRVECLDDYSHGQTMNRVSVTLESFRESFTTMPKLGAQAHCHPQIDSLEIIKLPLFTIIVIGCVRLC